MNKGILVALIFFVACSVSSGQQSKELNAQVLSKGSTEVPVMTSIDGKFKPGIKQFFYTMEKGTRLYLDYSLVSFTLDKVRIYEYPNTELYNAFRTKGDQIEITIPRSGVYVVEFENSGIAKRSVQYQIVGKDGPNATLKDTRVSFRTVFDTVKGVSELGRVVYTDTTFVDVLDQKVLVNSNANLSSSSKAIVSFALPQNTIKYSYYIGVSQEGVDAYKKAMNELAGSSASVLATVDPLLGMLVTGVSTIGTLNGGEDILYYLVENTPFVSNSNLFMAGQPFYSIRTSKVYNDASVIENINGRNLAFCFYNDNMVQSVDVFVKVKAICATPKTVVERQVPIVP